MSKIQEEIHRIQAGLPEHVRLVAVSKYHPIEALQEAYEGGQRIFGESKVQEMTQKYEALPKDIEWHFIGHLQTNKIKYMAPYVALIHGVDSYKLSTSKLQKLVVSFLACSRYTSPRKKPSSASLPTNAGPCWKKETGAN